MGWMLLHGRVTQTAGLFMVGMIIGRSNAFLYSEKNIKIWIKVFIIAVTAFFPIYGLINILPDFISREALLVPSVLLCKSLSNIAFTGIMFAGIILVYYLTTLKNVLHKFAPYGRMSLDQLPVTIFNRRILVLQLGIRTLSAYRHYSVYPYWCKRILFTILFL